MIITKYNLFMESTRTVNMWDILPPSIKDIHDLFKGAGKRLYVVGGCVRDFLNNEKPKDFDLATDALPEEVLKIVGKKYRTTVQGKSFGVVVAYTEDQPEGMEIATFREDVYGELLGKTRNPEVKYSTIDKDVARRDITWNALFYDLEKREIIDLVNGIEDLENGITRFVGDPDMRIKEDPLRILRIFRFTARYGFTIDPQTVESIKKNKSQLNIITRPRIWEEFFKAYKQTKSRFTDYLGYLDEFELWTEIFPGAQINHDIVPCSSLEVYIANLFTLEPVRGLQQKMVQTYLIPDDIARVSAWLIWFKSFQVENVLEFHDKARNYRISKTLISEWIKLSGLSDSKYLAFLEFERSVDSEDLMSKGFFKKALGDEIKRLEINNFNKILQTI